MDRSMINLLTTFNNIYHEISNRIQRYKDQNEKKIKLTTGYRNFKNFHYR